MGTQFVREETYAATTRKGSKSPSADGIIGEALRESGKCDHVEKPQKPSFVFGTEADLLAAREEVYRLAREGKTEVKRANGKVEKRKMASDAPTLAAFVFSYPGKSAALFNEWKAYNQIRREEEKRGRRPPPPPKSWLEVEKWKKLVVSFLQKKHGKNFKCALCHMDEEYLHIHAYVIAEQRPDGVVMLNGLHPGRDAKEAARREIVEGETKKEAAARQMRAYKAAMREFQNEYHEEVGKKTGQARFGPKRRRMTRGEWAEEKRRNRELADLLDVKEKAKQVLEVAKLQNEELAKTKATLDRVISSNEALAEERAKRIKPKVVGGGNVLGMSGKLFRPK